MSTETTTETRQDYEIAREELNTLFKSLRLEGVCTLIGLRTDESKWKHYLWNVTIQTEAGAGPRVSTDIPYRCGTGHVHPLKPGQNPRYHAPRPKAPSPAEVLACIAREVQDAQGAFEDWAADLGYDADSRKAEQTYHQCRTEARHLTSLGLSREDRRKLAELSARL